MKTVSLSILLGSVAATSNPTSAPTQFVVPTTPAINTAITVDMYSDSSCTQANDASKYTGLANDALNVDRGSRTWKANECIAVSATASMMINTNCLDGSNCVAGTSYDQTLYGSVDCSGAGVSQTVNYACTQAVAASTDSGSVVQYKKVTRYIPEENSMIAGLYNDAACKTSTTPFYITTGASSGTCSDIYTLGLGGYESRVSLIHENKQTLAVELFGKHNPTNPSSDPLLNCAAHLRVLRVEVNKGECTKLDTASATTLKALGACATTDCFVYAFTKEDLFPAAAITTTASVTVLLAAFSSLALLMQ